MTQLTHSGHFKICRSQDPATESLAERKCGVDRQHGDYYLQSVASTLGQLSTSLGPEKFLACGVAFLKLFWDLPCAGWLALSGLCLCFAPFRSLSSHGLATSRVGGKCVCLKARPPIYQFGGALLGEVRFLARLICQICQQFTYGAQRFFFAEILRKVRGSLQTYVYCVRKGCGNSAESCGNSEQIFCNDPFLNDPIGESLNLVFEIPRVKDSIFLQFARP